MRMPWGKFAGQPIADVPTAYLCWCAENATLGPQLADAIRGELGRRLGIGRHQQHQQHQHQAGPPAQLRDLVGSWFRRLSLRFHPDRGGTDQQMAAINAAREELESALAAWGRR